MTRDPSERSRRFETLFTEYAADVVAYCGWRAGSSSDAEDAVSEVFLAAWRRLEEVPEGDAARVWLYATARRVIANQRRSSRRRSALHDRLRAETPATAASPPPDGGETLVYEALRRLGPRDREILLLAEWEGLSSAEIAAVVGCPRVTARGRLHRARRRFHSLFEEVRAQAGERPSGRETSELTTTSPSSIPPIS